MNIDPNYEWPKVNELDSTNTFSLFKSEKDKLIQRLKYLSYMNDKKQERYRKEHGFSNAVSCLTQESLIMTALLPKMQELGVTFSNIKAIK